MSDEEAGQEEKHDLQNFENPNDIKEDYLERLKREAQKKNLKQIDYRPEELTTFRKDFYIECKEIKLQTDIEVK